ncbi:hypothetical protein ACTXG7_09350 [Mycolicibacterium sp. Dal123E01]|uniref:hypothetical protein n=1 Tax=Mycolicibacterium sp. Dal123E01 TaxID=3457578 RepID=UPI00403EB409
MTLQITRCIALLMVWAIAIAGCGFPDRRGAAESIGADIRALPGVKTADVHYDTSFDGGAHFHLHVTLAEGVTDAQAAAVGRTFVDKMRAADFASFDVALKVSYREVDDLSIRTPIGARAEFSYTFTNSTDGGPSSSDAADSMTLTLQIMQSPAVRAMWLTAPAYLGPANSRRITVALAPSAHDPDIAALMNGHPELRTATWQIVVGPPTGPEIYRVRGPFPDAQRRALWQRIVDTVGAAGSVDADTDTLDQQAVHSSVQVNVSGGPDNPRQIDQVVRAVTPLLPDLGLPLHVRFIGNTDDVEFTLGGCESPRPGHTPSPLETELRQRFQRC